MNLMYVEVSTMTIQAKPRMPAYIKYGTAKIAVTIEGVSPSKDKIFVREAHAVLADTGNYVHRANPHGSVHLCTLRSDGEYKVAGQSSHHLVVGEYQTVPELEVPEPPAPNDPYWPKGLPGPKPSKH